MNTRAAPSPAAILDNVSLTTSARMEVPKTFGAGFWLSSQISCCRGSSSEVEPVLGSSASEQGQEEEEVRFSSMLSINVRPQVFKHKLVFPTAQVGSRRGRRLGGPALPLCQHLLL